MHCTFVIVLFAPLILAGCAGSTGSASDDSFAGSTVNSSTASSGGSDYAINEFNITAKRFEFIPNQIVVNKGDHVRLRLTSVDVTHGFAIPEYDISQMLSPGQEEVVDFVADTPGSFRFFCSVPCGSGHSAMQGTLVVNP